MKRRGLGKGLGVGYKNLAPMDSHVHSLSAKGVKTISMRQNDKVSVLYQGHQFDLKRDINSNENLNIYKDGNKIYARGQMFSMYGSKWKVIEKGKDTVLLRNNKGEGLTITREEYDDYRPRDVHVEMPNYIYRDGKVIYKGTDRVMFGSLHYAKNYIKSLNPKAKKEAEIVLGAKGLTEEYDVDAKGKNISKAKKERYLGSLRYQYGNKARELSRKMFKKNMEDLTTEQEYDALFNKLHQSSNLNAKGKSSKQEDREIAMGIVKGYDVDPKSDEIKELIRFYVDGEISETTLQDRLYSMEEGE